MAEDKKAAGRELGASDLDSQPLPEFNSELWQRAGAGC